MTNSSEGFEHLLGRVNAGSHRAAKELHDMLRSRLLRAVRRRLPRKLRTKFDSVDFTQDAWLAFWEKYRGRGNFPDRDAFAAFLSRTAENIVIDIVRQRLDRQKRNIDREVPLDDGTTQHPRDFADERQLTPSHMAMRREEWRTFLRNQPPVIRRILVLYCAGLRSGEIAEELGLSRRSVNRAIKIVLDKLKKENLALS